MGYRGVGGWSLGNRRVGGRNRCRRHRSHRQSGWNVVHQLGPNPNSRVQLQPGSVTVPGNRLYRCTGWQLPGEREIRSRPAAQVRGGVGDRCCRRRFRCGSGIRSVCGLREYRGVGWFRGRVRDRGEGRICIGLRRRRGGRHRSWFRRLAAIASASRQHQAEHDGQHKQESCTSHSEAFPEHQLNSACAP